jgi:hypothetical protein
MILEIDGGFVCANSLLLDSTLSGTNYAPLHDIKGLPVTPPSLGVIIWGRKTIMISFFSGNDSPQTLKHPATLGM